MSHTFQGTTTTTTLSTKRSRYDDDDENHHQVREQQQQQQQQIQSELIVTIVDQNSSTTTIDMNECYNLDIERGDNNTTVFQASCVCSSSTDNNNKLHQHQSVEQQHATNYQMVQDHPNEMEHSQHPVVLDSSIDIYEDDDDDDFDADEYDETDDEDFIEMVDGCLDENDLMNDHPSDSDDDDDDDNDSEESSMHLQEEVKSAQRLQLFQPYQKEEQQEKQQQQMMYHHHNNVSNSTITTVATMVSNRDSSSSNSINSSFLFQKMMNHNDDDDLPMVTAATTTTTTHAVTAPIVQPVSTDNDDEYEYEYENDKYNYSFDPLDDDLYSIHELYALLKRDESYYVTTNNGTTSNASSTSFSSSSSFHKEMYQTPTTNNSKQLVDDDNKNKVKMNHHDHHHDFSKVIQDDWRNKICLWCFRVIDHWNYPRSVASITMNLIDRYVTCLLRIRQQRQQQQQQKATTTTSTSSCNEKILLLPISQSEYQLIAMTCLYLSIKLQGHNNSGGCSNQLGVCDNYNDQLYPNDSSRSNDDDYHGMMDRYPSRSRTTMLESILVLAKHEQFTSTDMHGMECTILRQLSYQVHPVTSQDMGHILLRYQLYPLLRNSQLSVVSNNKSSATTVGGGNNKEMTRAQWVRQQDHICCIIEELVFYLCELCVLNLNCYTTTTATASSPQKNHSSSSSTSTSSTTTTMEETIVHHCRPYPTAAAAILVAMEFIRESVLSVTVRNQFHHVLHLIDQRYDPIAIINQQQQQRHTNNKNHHNSSASFYDCGFCSNSSVAYSTVMEFHSMIHERLIVEFLNMIKEEEVQQQQQVANNNNNNNNDGNHSPIDSMSGGTSNNNNNNTNANAIAIGHQMEIFDVEKIHDCYHQYCTNDGVIRRQQQH